MPRPCCLTLCRLVYAAAPAYNVYGTLRRLQGRLEKSRIELEMAVERAPRYALALGQLGMTHLYRGQPEDALSRSSKAFACRWTVHRRRS